MNDNDLERRFRSIDFDHEPPMQSTAADDVVRGRRRLRRRRAATAGGSLLGVTAIAAGVAFALPSGSPPAMELPAAAGLAAGAPSEIETPTPTATPDPSTPPQSTGVEPAPDDVEMPYPMTRQRLLDQARAHFDPTGAHLPAESTGFTGGGTAEGSNVGTKLEWTYDDQDGMGLVQVAVTTPDYVVSAESALEDFALNNRCEIGSPQCVEQTVPGTDLRAWVVEADPAQNLVLSVIVERADGSLAAVSVSTLFGNNSTVPVTSIDIGLEQALGFVTDPELRVDPAEADEDWTGLLPKVLPTP